MTAQPTDLVGEWTLTRSVEDRLRGETLTVSGTATLAAQSADVVRWSEVGTMTWSGGSTPVSRTLYVVRRAAAWWVTFEDGRDFHPWSPGEPVDHPCAADRYRGLVEVGAPPVASWRVRWEVRGPQKDYTMNTRHDRPPSQGGPLT